MKFVDLYLDQGCDFTYTFKVNDPEGYPLDMTGYTLRGQFRQSALSNIAYNFDVVASDIGEITVTLDADTSEPLRFPRYQYDIEIVSPEGKVTRVKEGLVLVKFGVTRTN